MFPKGFSNFRNGFAIGKFIKLPWDTTCGNSEISLHLLLLLRFWGRAGGPVRRNLLFQSSNLPDPLGPFGIAKVAIGVTIFDRFRRWCSVEVPLIFQWRTHSRSCRIPCEYKQKSTFPGRRGGNSHVDIELPCTGTSSERKSLICLCFSNEIPTCLPTEIHETFMEHPLRKQLEIVTPIATFAVPKDHKGSRRLDDWKSNWPPCPTLETQKWP